MLVIMAFKPNTIVTNPLAFGFSLENFFRLFEMGFGVNIYNSLVIAVITVFLTTALGTIAGYFSSRFPHGATFYQRFMFTLRIIPPSAFMIGIFYLVAYQLGGYDTWWGMVLPMTALQTPLVFLIIKPFFDGISRELDEAALVDGCSYFQVFTKIILPVAKNGILVGMFFSFIYTYYDFATALVVIGSEWKTVTLALAGLKTQRIIRWGELFAGAFIATIPIIVISIIFNKYIIRGLLISTKG